MASNCANSSVSELCKDVWGVICAKLPSRAVVQNLMPLAKFLKEEGDFSLSKRLELCVPNIKVQIFSFTHRPNLCASMKESLDICIGMIEGPKQYPDVSRSQLPELLSTYHQHLKKMCKDVWSWLLLPTDYELSYRKHVIMMPNLKWRLGGCKTSGTKNLHWECSVFMACTIR